MAILSAPLASSPPPSSVVGCASLPESTNPAGEPASPGAGLAAPPPPSVGETYAISIDADERAAMTHRQQGRCEHDNAGKENSLSLHREPTRSSSPQRRERLERDG